MKNPFHWLFAPRVEIDAETQRKIELDLLNADLDQRLAVRKADRKPGNKFRGRVML